MAYDTLKDPVALQAEQAALQSSFCNRVFGWMFAGLAISGGVAWVIATRFVNILADQRIMLGAVIATLVLVFALSAGIKNMSASTAAFMFILYAALNGLMLSSIFLVYELGSIARAFGVSAGMFGIMGLWGYTTKQDLSGLGSICFMGLIGIIIASIVNIFVGSSTTELVISIFGVLIFTGLTAFDMQRIKRLAVAAGEGLLADEVVRKYSLIGALTLYLDFINLFLYILRFFGRRK